MRVRTVDDPARTTPFWGWWRDDHLIIKEVVVSTSHVEAGSIRIPTSAIISAVLFSRPWPYSWSSSLRVLRLNTEQRAYDIPDHRDAFDTLSLPVPLETDVDDPVPRHVKRWIALSLFVAAVVFILLVGGLQ